MSYSGLHTECHFASRGKQKWNNDLKNLKKICMFWLFQLYILYVYVNVCLFGVGCKVL